MEKKSEGLLEKKIKNKIEDKERGETHKEQLNKMSEEMEKEEKEKEDKVTKEAETRFRAEEGRGEIKRESFEERLVREAKEKLDSWVPKTSLGKEVKSKKITNIDEVLDSGRKIMEPEITDILIPNLFSNTLFIGQAKGKFGGGKRRAFRQTQKKTKESNVLTFGVMAVVGDGKGHVGIGYGKSSETLPARDKAFRNAKLNIVRIPRGCASFDCSCNEEHSIPTAVEGKCSSVKIKLLPAPQGTGLVTGDEIKKILKAVGIKDVYSKCTGKVRTTFNTAKACMSALNKLSEVKL